jgi:uncharacterized protein
MRFVFADTQYWIALASPSDHLHEKAKTASASLGNVILITTDEVMVEFLNYFAKYGPGSRNAAVKMVRAILSDPNVQVIPQTRSSFSAGLDLYEQRNDKDYSLTDCISLNVMKERGVTEVLTQDHHFSQEGMILLL